jgi:hypothetical protein
VKISLLREIKEMSINHLFVEDVYDDEDTTGKIHFKGNGNTYTLCGLETSGDSDLNLKESVITSKKVNCKHCIAIVLLCKKIRSTEYVIG